MSQSTDREMTSAMMYKDTHRDLRDRKPDDMRWADWLDALLSEADDPDIYLFDPEEAAEYLPNGGGNERQVFVKLDKVQEDVGTLADRLATLEAKIDGLGQ